MRKNDKLATIEGKLVTKKMMNNAMQVAIGNIIKGQSIEVLEMIQNFTMKKHCMQEIISIDKKRINQLEKR